MKDKNVTGILALFFGWLGIHRFYLGQIGLGILYMFFFWISWIIAFIDAIAFFSMDKDEFDYKYNRNVYDGGGPGRPYRRDTDFDRRQINRDRRMDERRRRTETSQRTPQGPGSPYRRPAVKRENPYKKSGIQKFREFDYDEAIEDFQKALEIEPDDVALHFNLACAYSLTEQADKAFFHLDRAVANGFNDFQRIKEKDALAYLRIQDKFDEFEANGFRLVQQIEAPKDDLLSSTPNDLLAQLKKLGDLREKGLLTEEEFTAQKKKLLG